MTHPDHDAEAQPLNGTVEAMIRQIEAWEDRNTGADLETSLSLADNAEELAAMLSAHVHTPYFGRMQVTIGGRAQALYIGKHAFRDLKGPHHFDACVAVNADNAPYDPAVEYERRLLYVTVSRGLHASGPLHDLLNAPPQAEKVPVLA